MTGRVVLDASAAVRLVLGLGGAESIAEVLERAAVVLAPDLFHAEVANALWKYCRGQHIRVEEALAHRETAAALVDREVPTEDLAREALWEASNRSHPVYDLLYLVLARRFGCAVCTADRKLASLARQMGLPVAEIQE
ncbi:type II toxin-antitoxin system VapC family toxin [Deferrisoma camini]|uniref:type II toxin-antitoxin system VapC family toxin n=1 Tax=Deferrisoma camini TaxID=1035120 RepID=UPI00046CE145|nr:type II toxin-antitoxin system VapC family toxin [Deferrisoma camini]